MKAQLLIKHGQVPEECYQYTEAHPQPNFEENSDDVLIRVSACGINNTDIWTREGMYSQSDEGSGWQPLSFPRIQGADVVGVVKKMGSKCSSSLQIGTRVLVYPAVMPLCLERPSKDGACECACHEAPPENMCPECEVYGITNCRYVGSERDGGFAEYCVVPQRNVFPVPHAEGAGLADTELASFATAYMTALHMVRRANVRAGSCVVVTGASGGVGVALVQLCLREGARVVALASKEKEAALHAVEAHLPDLPPAARLVVADRRAPNLQHELQRALQATGAAAADIVLDNVAGGSIMALLNVLRTGGAYASAGAISDPWVRVHWPTFYLKHLTLLGCMLATPREFRELAGLVESGKLQPVLAKAFSLRDLPAAQRFFMEKGFVGKVVIDHTL